MNNHITQGANHIWLPYTQMQNHLPQLEIASAKGSEIFLKDGRVLLDGISTLGKLLDAPTVQIEFISDGNLTVIQ